MMDKEEAIKCFEQLEADIEILKQMLACKDRLLELYDGSNEEERDQFIAEWDKLEDQLQTVVLFW